MLLSDSGLIANLYLCYVQKLPGKKTEYNRDGWIWNLNIYSIADMARASTKESAEAHAMAVAEDYGIRIKEVKVFAEKGQR